MGGKNDGEEKLLENREVSEVKRTRKEVDKLVAMCVSLRFPPPNHPLRSNLGKSPS